MWYQYLILSQYHYQYCLSSRPSPSWEVFLMKSWHWWNKNSLNWSPAGIDWVEDHPSTVSSIKMFGLIPPSDLRGLQHSLSLGRWALIFHWPRWSRKKNLWTFPTSPAWILRDETHGAPTWFSASHITEIGLFAGQFQPTVLRRMIFSNQNSDCLPPSIP